MTILLSSMLRDVVVALCADCGADGAGEGLVVGQAPHRDQEGAGLLGHLPQPPCASWRRDGWGQSQRSLSNRTQEAGGK